MEERRVRIAVIGAGTAGLAAMREADAATGDALLVEAGPFGTTCARVGCMPSKALLAAASAASHVRAAPAFGISCGAPAIDGAAVMARVRALRDTFVSHVLEEVERIPEEKRLRGHARFDGDEAVIVAAESGDVRVRAERVVIATGSRPTVPADFRHLSRLSTTDDMFDWEDLPASVAVFGAGNIGLELGQALTRLGVRTKLFGKHGDVGPLTDETLLSIARDRFRESLDFLPDFRLERLSEEDGEVRIDYRVGGEAHSERFERLLVAIGRTPNVDGLDLSTTSLERDESGVPVFDHRTCQCGDAPVFIAGDADDTVPLLHEAADTGRISGANAAAWPDVTRHERRVPLAIVFSEPQIALVGETRASLEDAGVAYRTGVVDFSEQGRARVMDEAVGRLHVYARAGSCELLGAEMVCPRAEHLAHLLALALELGVALPAMARMPFYHPTFEEGLRTAIRDAMAKARLADPPLPHGLSSGPGG